MPQGKIAKGSRSGVAVPDKEIYARKVENGGTHKSQSFSVSNPNFKSALPTMIRNAEMLAAGKLVQEGRVLFTGELGRLASVQVDMMHAKRRKSMKDPLAVLERPSKRIKGLRGEVDIEELTELVPSLKKQVAHERSERAKRERDLDLEMQNVQVRAHSHSAGGSAHKAKSAVEGLSAGGGGLSALMATAAEVGASSSSAAGAASAGIAGRKRPRPKAETLKRAISGARGDASREGDIVFSDNDDEEDKEAAANDGDAAGATGSAANGPKPPKRARTAAGRTKAGVGKGSRFGVNDTRPGSGAELQPLFGAGAAGAGAAASEFADL